METAALDRPSARLCAAVEGAYRIFKVYRPGAQLATCRCPQCMDDYTEQELLKTPVREIDFELLCEYTWSASGSNDQKFNPDELRHFLPRYLDFLAFGRFPNFAGEWPPTLNQLGILQYRNTWPAKEVGIVDEFFAALIDHHLAIPLGWTTTQLCEDMAYSEINDALGMIARGGGTMDTLLSEWGRHQSDTADHHLACMIKDCEWSLSNGYLQQGLPGPDWDSYPQQASTIRRWIYRHEHVDRLNRVIPSCETDKLRNLIVFARDAVLRNPTSAVHDDEPSPA